jgi:hypothetical protein
MTNVMKARTREYVCVNDTPEVCENGLLFVKKLLCPTLSTVLGLRPSYVVERKARYIEPVAQ